VYVVDVKPIAYCTYREDEFIVAQCLNVDVSSFGSTREEAIANLKEAVELYFDGESETTYIPVTEMAVGEEMVNA
jgi:predicted RNase H-like HicB family nuclease